MVVMAGLVDSHVHVNDPGRSEWEGFGTAGEAAAAGGTTTIVDMPLNSTPVTTTVAALEAKVSAAAGVCRVDFGLWGGIVPGNRGSCPVSSTLVRSGSRHSSFLPASMISRRSTTASWARGCLPSLRRACRSSSTPRTRARCARQIRGRARNGPRRGHPPPRRARSRVAALCGNRGPSPHRASSRPKRRWPSSPSRGRAVCRSRPRPALVSVVHRPGCGRRRHALQVRASDPRGTTSRGALARPLRRNARPRGLRPLSLSARHETAGRFCARGAGSRGSKLRLR